MFDQLLASGERVLGLNRIAEALGSLDVTSEEIGELLDALESAGRTTCDPGAPRAKESLLLVLQTARELKQESGGRTPTPHEISARSGLSVAAVQLALRFAEVLQRR